MALIKLTAKQKAVVIPIILLVWGWPLIQNGIDRRSDDAAEAARLKEKYLEAYSLSNAFLKKPDAANFNAAYTSLSGLNTFINNYRSKENLYPDYIQRLDEIQNKFNQLQAVVQNDGCNSACASARQRLEKATDQASDIKGDLLMIPTEHVVSMQVACNGLISNHDQQNGEAENVYRCGNLAPDAFGAQLAIETTSKSLGRMNAMVSAPQGAVRLFSLGDKMYSYIANTPEGPRIIQDVFPGYRLVPNAEPLKKQLAEKNAEVAQIRGELNAAKLQTLPALLAKANVILRGAVEAMHKSKSLD